MKNLSVLTISLILISGNISFSQWIIDSSVIKTFTVVSVTENDKFIFVGTNNKGIYRTLKNSNNWVKVSEGYNFDYYQIRSLAALDSVILAGFDNKAGIFRSNNNGGSWSPTNISNNDVQAILVKGKYIFAGLAQKKGVYRSIDTGKTFEAYNNGIEKLHIHCLAINEKYLLAGTGVNGIFITHIDSNIWRKSELGIFPVTVYDLLSYKNFVYAGTEGNGIYVSTNYGDSWEKSPLRESGKIFSLAFRNCYLFAATGNNGVCVLDKYGESIGSGFYDGPGRTEAIKIWFYKDYIFTGTSVGVFKRKLAGPYQE